MAKNSIVATLKQTIVKGTKSEKTGKVYKSDGLAVDTIGEGIQVSGTLYFRTADGKSLKLDNPKITIEGVTVQ